MTRRVSMTPAAKDEDKKHGGFGFEAAVLAIDSNCVPIGEPDQLTTDQLTTDQLTTDH